MNTEIVSSKYPYEDINYFDNIKVEEIRYRNFLGNTEPEMEATRKIIPKFKFYVEKIRLIAYYPESFEERVKAARAKIRKMSNEERWRLIEESFGMWEDYPEDWLISMREKTLYYRYSTESLNIIYEISR